MFLAPDGLPLAPLRFLTGIVLRRQHLTPGMVRVTLGGPDIASIVSTGVGDEYVRLFLPDPDSGELVLPEVDDKGRWRYPEGKVPAHTCCYTIRAHRAGEIDLDFVIHEGGRASAWALQARKGESIVLREPHPIYEAPADARRVVFLCDATGLPALARLLETLPAGVEAHAVVELPHSSHRLPLASRATLRLVWLHGSGNGVGPSRLPQALERAQLPQDGGAYVWVACEARAARQMRRHLRHDRGLPGRAYSVTGYWTDRQAEWEAGWRALDPGVRKLVDDLWVSGRDSEEIADEVDALMEQHGL